MLKQQQSKSSINHAALFQNQVHTQFKFEQLLESLKLAPRGLIFNEHSSSMTTMTAAMDVGVDDVVICVDQPMTAKLCRINRLQHCGRQTGDADQRRNEEPYDELSSGTTTKT